MNVSQFSAVNFIYFFPQFVLGLPLVISVFQQNYSLWQLDRVITVLEASPCDCRMHYH